MHRAGSAQSQECPSPHGVPPMETTMMVSGCPWPTEMGEWDVLDVCS